MLDTLGRDRTAPATRIAIFQSLAQMGPAAKSAVPVLEAGLRCDQGSTKLQRAYALLCITREHKAALDALHVAARGDDEAQKLEALAALSRSGCKDKELIPTMLALVIADDARYHNDSMTTLVHIGPAAVDPLLDSITQPGCRRIRRALYAENPKHTDRVVSVLHRMGPGAAEAIPVFVQLLEGKDAGLAVYAAQALPEFGPGARQAIPALRAALRPEAAQLCLASAASLARIDGKEAAHTITPLVKLVETGKDDIKSRALSQLIAFSADAKPAVPALLALLKTEKLDARVRIAAAIRTIDPSRHEAILPTLLEALQAPVDGPDDEDRVMDAVEMLAALGAKARPAVPALKSLLQVSLKSKQQYMPASMLAQTLQTIDPSADLMPIVIEGLNSDEMTRNRAMLLVRRVRMPNALAALDAALANGTLQTSHEVASLLKTLRPQEPGQ
jgi:hypothetical protein